MKRSIIKYINKLQGYTTAIKNLHWSSKNMSEHKLCDDISDKILSVEDEIAEIAQGIYGQIEANELKPTYYKISTTQQMLNDLLRDTEKYYDKLKGPKYIGMRSVVEAFLGDINKFQYLIKLCLKEDIKFRLMGKRMVNEGYETVEWQHFDNRERYESFVVIDNSDQSVVTTFPVMFDQNDAESDAIECAKEEVQYNGSGSYSVYGCNGGKYDEDTLVYSTDNEYVTESIVRKIVRESINRLIR